MAQLMLNNYSGKCFCAVSLTHHLRGYREGFVTIKII